MRELDSRLKRSDLVSVSTPVLPFLNGTRASEQSGRLSPCQIMQLSLSLLILIPLDTPGPLFIRRSQLPSQTKTSCAIHTCCLTVPSP